MALAALRSMKTLLPVATTLMALACSDDGKLHDGPGATDGGDAASTIVADAPSEAGVVGRIDAGTTGAHGALIRGDARACPTRAAPQKACSVDGLSCTYQGGDSGISSTNVPVTCTCTSALWTCLETDANGDTPCPRTYPPSGGCSTPLNCRYLTSLTIASCYCRPSMAGGFGGAPGNDAGTNSWLCGL